MRGVGSGGFLVLVLLCVCPWWLMGVPVVRTASWRNADRDFAQFAATIEENGLRNLAVRPEARLHGGRHLAPLVDGDAGVRGGEGRVGLGNGAQPAVVRLYLGKVTPVHAVGLYTFNIDERANQVYEVRFALHDRQPGKVPEFPSEPHLTTGPTVLGPNAGGFHTRFEQPDGTPLVDRADWVEFRVWPTYKLRAGSPAHPQDAAGLSWCSAIEVEVLGAPGDVLSLSPEILARRAELKRLPKNPPLLKRATWEQTLLDSRRAMLAWEKSHDDLLLPEHGATLAPWQAAGPFPKGTRDVPPDAQWNPIPQLRDGHGIDLASLLGAQPEQVIFLRRTLTAARPLSAGYPLVADIALRDGSAWVDGCRVGGHPDGRLQRWSITAARGERQLNVRLAVASDGRCGFHFQAQATGRSRISAGSVEDRVQRRRAQFDQVARLFPDWLSHEQMVWEDTDRIWVDARDGMMAAVHWLSDEWAPDLEPLWLAGRYRQALPNRLAALREDLRLQPQSLQDEARPWLEAFERTLQDSPPLAYQADRDRYRDVMAVTLAVRLLHDIESARLAVEDQLATFPERHAERGQAFRPVLAEQRQLAEGLLRRILAPQGGGRLLPELAGARQQWEATAHPILLQNPLLDFDRLLFVRGGFHFNNNWSGANFLGNEFAVLSPVRPDGAITTLAKVGRITDFDLDFDAKSILYGNGRHIMELSLESGQTRQVTRIEDPHVQHFDACYLPSGGVAFCSTACEEAVPCTGQWYVANLHVADRDGANERRICFDQDHNWNPSVLNNGRLIYTRWEYTDTPHYFSRLLFHANPDGTGQMEYYGSNSYWPNSLFWPRAIPGHPTAISCVVSGHHGTSRQGELVIIDPARGRSEATGVVQRIPGRGRQVEPRIVDNLVDKSWPKFAAPYPLAEPGTDRGAGRYFLVTMRRDRLAPWGIYLVDTFDNLVPLLMGNYVNAVPLRPRRRPPVITPKVDPARATGHVYLADVLQGPGLRGYPKGIVKSLRVGAHHYRYGGNGDTYASGYDGGWDVKRILGTVPVAPDGSAFFEVPANTPIFVQPLDQDGKALQTMRSWFVAMPGETASCVGCHEPQNSVAPARAAEAARRPPVPLRPWLGPARGFGFDQEVQPVLDRRCVGCHDDSQPADGQARRRPDFRAKALRPDWKRPYSPAYLALHPYVRRAGIEADYVMQKPGEWDADTSPLVQMLRKGHHGVRLTDEEWQRLYTWIDFNVPYAPNWRQSHRPPTDEQVERRARYKRQLAGLDDQDEAPLPAPSPQPFVRPEPEPPSPPPPALDGWPLSDQEARAAQARLGKESLTLDLGEGVTMAFVPIPTGKAVLGDPKGAPDERVTRVHEQRRPFWLGRCEVTNRQFARFDADHDSAYIDMRNKDRITRGTPLNAPEQPVIRITRRQAEAFCRWLSERTGRSCSLPTEQEWEYACRAGTDTPWSFGARPDGKEAVPVANVSDASLQRWNWGRVQPDYRDGQPFSAAVGTFPPNRWGLHDMHGNVAEWTASPYLPDQPHLATVRGGSWNDLFAQTRSASRWRYPEWQPVYNVGFRVKVEW